MIDDSIEDQVEALVQNQFPLSFCRRLFQINWKQLNDFFA